MQKSRTILMFFFLLFLQLLLSSTLNASAPYVAGGGITYTSAYVVSIEPPWDTIDDGVKECVINALDAAERDGKALIVRVDSYGGMLESGFSIGDAFATAKVPVIAYVTGGNALSAATLIILPANIIALSPHSIIGAMQPIMYNPATGEVTFVNESKLINPVVTKAVSYAELRGRNVTLVEDFVRKAATINAQEAVQYGVADLIVTDMSDLLRSIKGLEVNTSVGPAVLEITSTEEYECGLRSRAISLFQNPMISSVLMTIGILGTLFALISGKLPVLPVTLLFLLLGLIGSGFNPNLISLFMLLLGAILLAVELFVTPGFGIVGITGIVLISLGIALSPVNIPPGTAPPPQYGAALRNLAMLIGGLLGVLGALIIYKIVKTKMKAPTEFTPLGKVGEAVEDLEPGREGFVVVEGEYWKARPSKPIPKGSKVKVVGMEEAVLLVEPEEQST